MCRQRQRRDVRSVQQRRHRLWCGARTGRHARRADIAVVSDRGCDRLRFYRIVPKLAEDLVDITDPGVPRVHPWRITQPSPLQPSGMPAGLHDNPVDTQDNAYRSRPVAQAQAARVRLAAQPEPVGQVEVLATSRGHAHLPSGRSILSTCSFAAAASRPRGMDAVSEEAAVDPQAEGIVIDQQEGILYVAVETVGIYDLKLDDRMPRLMIVGRQHLLDVAQTFGLPYHATPDDEEFSCDYQTTDPPSADRIVADGTQRFAGRHLQIDVEGLTIYYGSTQERVSHRIESGFEHAARLQPPVRQRARRQLSGGRRRRHRRTRRRQRGARPVFHPAARRPQRRGAGAGEYQPDQRLQQYDAIRRSGSSCDGTPWRWPSTIRCGSSPGRLRELSTGGLQNRSESGGRIQLTAWTL